MLPANIMPKVDDVFLTRSNNSMRIIHIDIANNVMLGVMEGNSNLVGLWKINGATRNQTLCTDLIKRAPKKIYRYFIVCEKVKYNYGWHSTTTTENLTTCVYKTKKAFHENLRKYKGNSDVRLLESFKMLEDSGKIEDWVAYERNNNRIDTPKDTAGSK